MKEKYIEETGEWELSWDISDPEDKELFDMFSKYCKENGIEENKENFEKIIKTAIETVVEANK